MKKLLFVGLVSVSFAQAKLFVGADVGYDMGHFELTQKVSNLGSTAFSGAGVQDHNFYAGLNIGTEHLFGEYFGLRWHFGVGYTSAFQTAELNLGFDVLFNFVNTGSTSFGLFVGVGTAFQAIFPGLVNVDYRGEIPINGRVGFSFGLGEHNRIDILAHIPITTLSIKAFDNQIGEIYSPVRISVGYKFIF